MIIRQDNLLATILFYLALETILRKLDVVGNISTELKQVCAYSKGIVITARKK